MPDTFLDRFILHNKDYESPTSFWRWSAYVTIASVLKDRCCLRFGEKSLYPNMYVMFLAGSGERKDAPIKSSEKLVTALNITKTISGRATVHAILDELARAETDKQTGKVLRSNTATIYAPELSAGIVNDSEGLKMLTDIYEHKETPYKNRLRTGPCFDLEKIVISMISGTNHAMIQDFIGSSEIKGGFLARTFLVVPNEYRPGNALLDVDYDSLGKSWKCVEKSLREIANLHGIFTISDDGKKEYKRWYIPFHDSLKNRKDETGVLGRIHVGILKLAICLAANELSMELTKTHIEQAIEQCLALVPNYTLFTMSHAKTDVGSVGGLLITELLQAPNYMLSRKEIMRKHWQTFDPDMLEKAVLALETAGNLQQYSYQGNISYTLTRQCLEMMGVKFDNSKT